METKRLIPQPVTGYELGDIPGFFSVVVAEESTNLVTNPSFEIGLTGYVGFNSAVVTRSSVFARRGFFSAKISSVSAAGGVQYAFTAVIGTTYTFSADVKGVKGARHAIACAHVGAGSRKFFIGNGNWQRIFITFTATAATSWLQIYAYSNITTFYTDGWQLEEKTYPTTYFDGDMEGYVFNQVAYTWTGLQHASASSRISETKSGGREYKLSDIGFRTIAFSGLGLPDIENIAQDLWAGGSFYHRTLERNRTVTIVGAITGSSSDELDRIRRKLLSVMYDKNINIDQPTLLKFHRVHDGIETGEVIDIPCFYQSGLNVLVDNYYQENIALSFIQYLPFLYYDTPLVFSPEVTRPLDSEGGAVLAYNRYGGTQAVGGGTRKVWIKNLPENNTIALYDNSTNMGGIANTIGISLLIDTIPTALGTGGVTLGGGFVKDVCAFPGANYGKVVIVGSFTAVGGVANTAHIALYNEAGVWTSLKSAFVGSIINGCIFDAYGNLIVTGAFTSINGVAANNIAYYNFKTGVWDNIGTGLDAAGTGFVKSSNGSIYVYGSFLNANAISTGKICQILIDTTLATPTVNFAKMNGQLINHADTVIRDAIFHSDGYLYIVGFRMSLNGISTTNHSMRWNGSTWTDIGLDQGTSQDIYTIRKYKNNLMMDGWVKDSYYWMHTFLGKGNIYDYNEIQSRKLQPHAINFAFDWKASGDGAIFVDTDELSSFPAVSDYINSYEDSNEVEIMIIGKMVIRAIEVMNTGSFIRFGGKNGYGFDIPEGVTVLIKYSSTNFSIKTFSGIDFSSKLLSRSSKFTIRSGLNKIRISADRDSGQLSGPPSIISMPTGITADNSDVGRLYYRTNAGPNFTISIYKDSARTLLVGLSDVFTVGFTPVNITPQNGSGLGGKIEGAAFAASDAGYLSHGLFYMSYKKRAISIA